MITLEDKKLCEDTALKYKTKKDFKAKDPKVYNLAKKHNLLFSICTHMKNNKQMWSIELASKEAKKYSTGCAKKSPKNIQETLIAKFRNIYGNTTKSYAHLGHFHHIDMKENPTMIVEQHRTMASPDAYSSNGGYLSGRSAYVITYDYIYGEVNRINVSAELVESLMK